MKPRGEKAKHTRELKSLWCSWRAEWGWPGAREVRPEAESRDQTLLDLKAWCVGLCSKVSEEPL